MSEGIVKYCKAHGIALASVLLFMLFIFADSVSGRLNPRQDGSPASHWHFISFISAILSWSLMAWASGGKVKEVKGIAVESK